MYESGLFIQSLQPYLAGVCSAECSAATQTHTRHRTVMNTQQASPKRKSAWNKVVCNKKKNSQHYCY